MKTVIFHAATCPTCCRGPSNPYRVVDVRGHVIQGCVDEFHTGHLVTPSASAAWHARREAKTVRRLMKAGRDGGVTHFQAGV